MPTLNWSESAIQAVWEKGQTARNNDPDVWRLDACVAWMKRSAYGDRNSMYGWEVDHIDPNGGNYLDNLQPLQWQNNVAKGDGPLRCAVRANGTQNLY